MIESKAIDDGLKFRDQLDANVQCKKGEVMRSEFEKWYRDKYQVTKQLYFFKDTQQYEDGFAQDAWEVWQHQQSKVDELQKRVDAAIYLLPSIKAENDLWGCDQVSRQIELLEQALKGGSNESKPSDKNKPA